MSRSGYSCFVINSLDYVGVKNANPTFNFHVVGKFYMFGSITTNAVIYQTADEIQGLYQKSDTTQISKLWGASYRMF